MNNEIKNKNKPQPFSALCHKMIYVTTMSSVSSSTCFAFNFREPRLQGGKKKPKISNSSVSLKLLRHPKFKCTFRLYDSQRINLRVDFLKIVYFVLYEGSNNRISRLFI